MLVLENLDTGTLTNHPEGMLRLEEREIYIEILFHSPACFCHTDTAHFRPGLWIRIRIHFPSWIRIQEGKFVN